MRKARRGGGLARALVVLQIAPRRGHGAHSRVRRIRDDQRAVPSRAAGRRGSHRERGEVPAPERRRGGGGRASGGEGDARGGAAGDEFGFSGDDRGGDRRLRRAAPTRDQRRARARGGRGEVSQGEGHVREAAARASRRRHRGVGEGASRHGDGCEAPRRNARGVPRRRRGSGDVRARGRRRVEREPRDGFFFSAWRRLVDGRRRERFAARGEPAEPRGCRRPTWRVHVRARVASLRAREAALVARPRGAPARRRRDRRLRRLKLVPPARTARCSCAGSTRRETCTPSR